MVALVFPRPDREAGGAGHLRRSRCLVRHRPHTYGGGGIRQPTPRAARPGNGACDVRGLRHASNGLTSTIGERRRRTTPNPRPFHSHVHRRAATDARMRQAKPAKQRCWPPPSASASRPGYADATQRQAPKTIGRLAKMETRPPRFAVTGPGEAGRQPRSPRERGSSSLG